MLFFWGTSLVSPPSKRIPKIGGFVGWHCLSKCLLAGFLQEWKLQHHLLTVWICYSSSKLSWDLNNTFSTFTRSCLELATENVKADIPSPLAVQQVCAILTNPTSVPLPPWRHCYWVDKRFPWQTRKLICYLPFGGNWNALSPIFC